jgi:hypothetical protein
MITTFSVAACWAARGGIRGGEREFSWTQDESTSRVGKAAGLMAAASLPHPGQGRGAARIAAKAAGPLGAVDGNRRHRPGPGEVPTALTVDDTSADADLQPSLAPEDQFEVARRGYDRRQVEEFVARSRREVADMRSRLAHALREAEQLRVDLAAARRAAWETAGQGERMARELTALRTQAQMALARNLWWPPPQPEGE